MRAAHHRGHSCPPARRRCACPTHTDFCIKDKATNPLLHPAAEAKRPKDWLKAIDMGCSQQLPGALPRCRCRVSHAPSVPHPAAHAHRPSLLAPAHPAHPRPPCSCAPAGPRSLTKRTGTPVYMAPEIFHRRYHVEADMWSVGVMLYQLFARRFPFWLSMEECKASKLEEVAAAVVDGPLPFDYGPWLAMSPEGLDFVKVRGVWVGHGRGVQLHGRGGCDGHMGTRAAVLMPAVPAPLCAPQGCLTRDPQKRMTVEQALAHPWLLRELSAQGAQQHAQPAPQGNNIVCKAQAAAGSPAPAPGLTKVAVPAAA